MKKIIILVSLSLTALGCRSVQRKPVILHPILGTDCMIVPAGTPIGEYKAPSNGVYLSENAFMQMLYEIISSSKEDSTVW